MREKVAEIVCRFLKEVGASDDAGSPVFCTLVGENVMDVIEHYYIRKNFVGIDGFPRNFSMDTEAQNTEIRNQVFRLVSDLNDCTAEVVGKEERLALIKYEMLRECHELAYDCYIDVLEISDHEIPWTMFEEFKVFEGE